ncbi:ATP-binding protein [Kitasatospora sp. NPDC059973]|uniref:ATP-binding protein n=1 Tax=Kitasatospora sp. NPDC059973 TaxID=3347020 RepID=UPI003685A1CD
MPPTKDVPGLVNEHKLGDLLDSREIRFADADRPPAVARKAVRSALGRRMPELVDDVVLVTDELVTNADTHGGGSVGLILRLYERGAAVVVEDLCGSIEKITDNLSAESDAEEQRVDALQLAEGGRGLFLVDAYAAGWGVETASSPGSCGATVVAVFSLGAAS